MNVIKIADNTTDTALRPQMEGKIIVTDGCYVLPTEIWDKTIDFWGFDDHPEGHDWIMIEVDGIRMIMFSTANGDGEYPVIMRGDRVGSASVDSGTLALIPVSFNQKEAESLVHQDLGAIIDLDRPYYFHCFRRGVIRIGKWRVNTEVDC